MIDLQALANECGVEFYDAQAVSENGKNIYRVFITKKNGVSLQDCENLSRLLSPLYDVEPPIGGDWILEVSSPGLERKLITKEHFKNSIFELVKITTINKEKVEGKILEFDGEILKLEISSEKNQIINIPFKDIIKAKTYIIW